jgi:ABC-type Fe3+/spermidine/putrescine transport system ATPase subunit
MEAPTISVRSLSKSFASEEVLQDVTFDVGSDEFCILMGPSGCGKSTLLKCIAGIHDYQEGEVRLRGESVAGSPPEDRDLGFVFQEFDETLFPHMTVEENIAFGLELQDQALTDEEIDERVDELLEMLGMQETKHDLPENLSGGQQQRVELARQLARECDVVLLDDPLGDLDYKLQKYMEIELRRIQDETGSSYLHVTHNQDEGLSLADRLVVMNEGHIEQVGTPIEVYEAPATAFVNRFIGDSTILVGDLVEGDGETVLLNTEIGEVAATVENRSIGCDETAVALVRPEVIEIGTESTVEADNTFEGQLTGRTFTGDETEFTVAVEGLEETVLIKRPGIAEFDRIGETVSIGWEATDTNAFGPADFSDVESTTIDDITSIE